MEPFMELSDPEPPSAAAAYGRDIQLIDKQAWIRGGSLGARDARNYSSDPSNLGHARGEHYRAAMAEVYAACTSALKPGGFLAVVTKNLRAGGALHDLAGATVELCQQTGLLYWQHVIALHAAIRDGELVPRPSFWQLSTTRKALARGERIRLVCHEDVLVFCEADAAALACAGREQALRRRRHERRTRAASRGRGGGALGLAGRADDRARAAARPLPARFDRAPRQDAA
jgi:hypothetical protein